MTSAFRWLSGGGADAAEADAAPHDEMTETALEPVDLPAHVQAFLALKSAQKS